MKTYEEFKKLIKDNPKYPTESDLIYRFGFMRFDLEKINQEKLKDNDFNKIILEDEFNKPLLFWNDEKITSNFLGSQDLIRNSLMNQFSDFSDSEVLNGFIFSEIESSLAIEGLRSTRAQIEKINNTDYADLKERNDIIIKNMLLAYNFVKENNITEENMFALYSILSRNCLKEDEQLLEGNYYRHDDVTIVDSSGIVVDRGVDYKSLKKLMKALITYINSNKTYDEHLLASHIIHYYIILLHPYFDYNGRIARVMSFWYNYKFAPSLSLLLVSESINNRIHKKAYYNAIMNSRKTENDITFFLEFMGDIIIKYSKIYVNFYNIKNELKGRGEPLTRATELALKYVLTIPIVGEGYFSWRDYQASSFEDFSKQYYLRLLNELVTLDILLFKEHKKVNLYKLNKEKWNLF